MAIELAAQIVSITSMVLLAWVTRSIWALVIGGVFGTAAHLVLAHCMLPGTTNRFRWERSAVLELVHFGKWLFLSTALAFFIAQGDKAILGRYLSLQTLGVYNIGYFLASFPLSLGVAVVGRIFLPLYRGLPTSESGQNFRKIRLIRFAITGGLMLLLLALALGGNVIVQTLYDSRYSAAGAIAVVIACAQIVQVVGLTYDQAALAAGDSRNFFTLFAVRAIVHVTLLMVGVELYGLTGAIAGQGIAIVLIHPLIVRLARRHGVWDPLHDAIFLLLGVGFGALALWINWDAIEELRTFGTV